MPTQKDSNGLEYVTIAQEKRYLGTQLHPERPQFENLSKSILHTVPAKQLSQARSMDLVVVR